jgi:hypothetical protein
MSLVVERWLVICITVIAVAVCVYKAATVKPASPPAAVKCQCSCQDDSEEDPDETDRELIRNIRPLAKP